MATLFMMVGNVGSGKTTIAKSLQGDRKFSLYVSDDEITTMLNGDYTDEFFTERHKKLYEHILINMVHHALTLDFDIIVDSCLHLISEDGRRNFINVAKLCNAEVISYVISHPHALERRLSNARSNGGTDWTAVYNRFEKLYDPPVLTEGIDEILYFVGNQERR